MIHTIEYQENILKYLLQFRHTKKYLEQIDSGIFDSKSHQVVLDTIQNYLKQYRTIPSQVNLIEFMSRLYAPAVKTGKVSKDVMKELDRIITKIYEPLQQDTTMINETVVEYLQYKSVKENIFKKYAPKVNNEESPASVIKDMISEMNKIVRMSDSDIDDQKNRGGFLLKDYVKSSGFVYKEGNPTAFNALNKMTSAGGFYAPQIICIMSGPKAFKTGTLINLAINFMYDGLKVYYADTENGIHSIRQRAYQCMTHSTYEELKSGKVDDKLQSIISKAMALGGDMEIDFYPMDQCSLNDVDANLTFLKEEKGWVPDVIFIDYAHKFRARDTKIFDKRLKIQAVFSDMKWLNDKWDVFSITPVPVKQKAVAKKKMNMEDIGEDFAQIYNADAVYALCQTKEEKDLNLARLVSIAQREGVEFGTCYLEIDKARIVAKELSEEDFLAAGIDTAGDDNEKPKFQTGASTEKDEEELEDLPF